MQLMVDAEKNIGPVARFIRRAFNVDRVEAACQNLQNLRSQNAGSQQLEQVKEKLIREEGINRLRWWILTAEEAAGAALIMTAYLLRK